VTGESGANLCNGPRLRSSNDSFRCRQMAWLRESDDRRLLYKRSVVCMRQLTEFWQRFIEKRGRGMHSVNVYIDVG
jgi:hypothetical protein